MTSVEYRIFTILAAAGFRDGIERRVKTVPEHREYCHFAVMIDGVVAPLSTSDTTAVHVKQLPQFLTAEEDTAFSLFPLYAFNSIIVVIVYSSPLTLSADYRRVLTTVSARHRFHRIWRRVAGGLTQRTVAIDRLLDDLALEAVAAHWPAIFNIFQQVTFFPGSPFSNVIRGQFVRVDNIRQTRADHIDGPGAAGCK